MFYRWAKFVNETSGVDNIPPQEVEDVDKILAFFALKVRNIYGKISVQVSTSFCMQQIDELFWVMHIVNISGYCRMKQYGYSMHNE